MSNNTHEVNAQNTDDASNEVDFLNKKTVMEMLMATSSIRMKLMRARVVFVLLTCIVTALLSVSAFNWYQYEIMPTNQLIIVTAVLLGIFTYTYSEISSLSRVIDVMIGLSANMGMAYTLKTNNACPPPVEIELEKIYKSIFSR